MIRWYDYVIAVIAADMISASLIFGFTGTTFWHGVIGGAIAGLTYRMWEDLYCDLRKKFEEKSR
jgi:hypothetical protein